MADLLETSTFAAGITRIENNEPVIGGEDGVANRAPKLLASRTRWLKDQLDALAATLGSLYALRTGDYTTLRARATTKDDVGLGLVANYAPTNDASGGSTTKVATAAAVQAALASVVVAPTNLGVGGSGDARTVTSSTGAAASLPLATSAAAGLMRAADKAKLDGVATGAQPNVGTNLSNTPYINSVKIGSSTGADTLILNATTALAGTMSPTDKAKLDGVAAGAQVNPTTTPSRTDNSTTKVLQAKAMNDHRLSGDHDARYALRAAAWPGVYSGASSTNLTFPVGTTLLLGSRALRRNATVTVRLDPGNTTKYLPSGTGSVLTGTWAVRGDTIYSDHGQLVQRVA